MNKRNAPRVYIAAPFFNPVQVSIVARIEELLERRGYDYYSPRKDSGSDKLMSEQRKDFNAWKPVIKSNKDELQICDLMIAVVEYAMPNNMKLAVAEETQVCPHCGDGPDYCHVAGGYGKLIKSDLELPDNGVVFECGAFDMLTKPIVGFHTTKQPNEINLMLSHTIQGLITGWEKLEEFCHFASTVSWKCNCWRCAFDWHESVVPLPTGEVI